MNTFSDQLVLWVINVLIHSSVLTAVLLCVAILFRKRAAMRYWILCCGLLLVLASPAVSALVQSQGTGWLTLALPDETIPTATVAATEQPTPANDSPMKSLPTQQINASITPPVLDASSVEEIASTPVVSKPTMVADVPANPSPTTATVKDSRSPMQWLAIIVTIATVVWAMGATLLLMRMTIGWIRLAGILRQAEPIADPGYVAAFIEACDLAGCHEGHTPRLLASDEISGPLAAGIFAGSVVLPKRLIADSSPTELAEVFVHEVAHVVRRDQIVVLLQNLVAAIYWPHPLVRKLNRELAKAREEVCDNFVLATTEAPIYSRTLLSLAQLVQQPETIPGSVGFFASRWKLEHRVAGLLDEARDTQTFLSRRGWAFVLASTVGLLAAICVGTVTIATAQNSNEDSVAESTNPSRSITVDGIVRDPDGKPIAGARVIALQHFRANVSWTTDSVILAETTSDQMGRYQMRVEPDSDRFSNGMHLEKEHLSVLATFAGFGPDEQTFFDNETTVDLSLADARHDITGQIVDLEGKPIRGVQVRLRDLQRPLTAIDRSEAVDKWIEAAKKAAAHNENVSDSDPFGGLTTQSRTAFYPTAEHLRGIATLDIRTQTDDEGRFRLTDIGDDRQAILQIDGAGIASSLLPVVAREMLPINTAWMGPQYRTGKTFGSQFRLSAEPEQIVQGIVKDRKTGEPISGARLSLYQLPDDLLVINGFLSTTSDAEGRYVLSGIPRNTKQSGGTVKIKVHPPSDQPYFRSKHSVPVTGGLEPIQFDIGLTRGIWATGRVTEGESGKPVAGLVGYHPYIDNPNAADHEAFNAGLTAMGYEETFATDADGRFRVPALRGKGVLRAIASKEEEYRLQTVPGTTINDAGGIRPGERMIYHNIMPGNGVVDIDVDGDMESANANIELTRVKTLSVSVVNPDGKPASGFRVAGRRISTRVTISGRGSRYWEKERFSSSKFNVFVGDAQERTRPLFISDAKNQLGAVVWLDDVDNEETTLTVKLEPNAKIIGQVINQNNESREKQYLQIRVGDAQKIDGMSQTKKGARPIVSKQLRFPLPGVVRPDDDGRFELSIPPSNRCSLLLKNQPGDPMLLDNESAPAGSTIDLGKIDLNADPKSWPKPVRIGARNANQQTTKTPNADSSPISISGFVRGQGGEPIANAKIWLNVKTHRHVNEANRGYQKGLMRNLGTADEQGRFEFPLDAATTELIRQRSHATQTLIVATANGYGLGWMPLDVFENNPAPSEERKTLESLVDASLGDGSYVRRTLQLPLETEPIRGRLVDLEGNRLANVEVSVERLWRPDITRLLKAFQTSFKQEVNEAFGAKFVGRLARSGLQKLIPSVTTDQNGEFVLRGVGDDQLVTLVFTGDRVQAHPLNVLGREIKTVSLPHIKSYPNGAKDIFVGRDFTHAIGPSVPVEGVVTDYDTGQPITGVLVYVERLFREGSPNASQLRIDTNHMRAVTDDRGRFRITGMPPGELHVLECEPPKSLPYFAVSHDVSLSLEDGDSKRIDLQMKRGIWIEGRVIDKKSGQPLSATVDYIALEKNPHSLAEIGLRRAWVEERNGTDSDGRYRVIGFPGPGVLMVNSLVPGYPFADGAETIDGYNPSTGKIPTTPFPVPASDWHLLDQINPAKDATSFTSNLRLDGGVRIPGRVVGPGNQKITDLHVLGLTEQDPYWSPKYQDQVRLTNRFTVNGYDGIGPRQLFFKTKDESLVGQTRIEGDAPEEITVPLEPSVRVTGRLIESKTELPAPGYFISCQECSFNEQTPSIKFMIHWCNTDEEGRFEINGLMAGLTYKMRTSNESNDRNKDNDFTIDLTRAKPGETIELGGVPGPGSVSEIKN